MREADVVAAVQDQLALGLVHERVARARADHLVGRARGRRRRACASMSASPAATRWTNASMFVITLITDALPSGPTWMTAPPIASSSGAVRREDRLVAAGDDGDLAGGRQVDAAGDRGTRASRCRARRRARRAARARAGRSCSCRSRCRRAAGPRARRRRRRRPRSTARGDGRQVITQSAASRDRARRARPQSRRRRRAPRRRPASRSCTESGKPARSRLAASWRPRLPRPTKPTFTAPSRRTRTRPVAASRCSASPLYGCASATASSSSTPRPGAVGGMHVAVLPADRLLQQLGVEAVPAPDALEDQEVRACRSRAGCWRRRRPARSRGAARSARSAPRPCAAIFFASSRPPTRPRFICRIDGGAGLEHARELVLRRQPLAGRDRDRRRARDARHLLRRLGRRRLLEPERVVRARAAARAGSRPTAVNWPCVPNSRSQRGADRLAHRARRSARSDRARRATAAAGRTTCTAPAGSNLSAVKPSAAYSAARSAASSGSR